APGIGSRDHTRAAIQTFSREVHTRTIFTHTGWREIGGRTVFLHAGGAIGAEGSIRDVDVQLPDALTGYNLPDPPQGEQLIKCIRASLEFLEVAADSISFPVFCAVYRAVLGSCDSSEHLAGPSGVFKSELAALGNQHFGAGLDARHLPGSWASTDNALEG